MANTDNQLFVHNYEYWNAIAADSISSAINCVKAAQSAISIGDDKRADELLIIVNNCIQEAIDARKYAMDNWKMYEKENANA